MKLLYMISAAALVFTFATSASATFNPQGNNTVWDDKTGLIWQQATGETSTLTQFKWSGGPADDGVCAAGGVDAQVDALCYCENLELAGYDDWRLPDRNELMSLVDYNSSTAPLIDQAAFPGTYPIYYWTSTTGSSWNGGGYDYDSAVAIRFDRGFALADIAKSSTLYVRCVRGREFQVSVSAGDHLSVNPSVGTHWVAYNDTFNATYTAEAGYNISNVTVDGVDLGPQSSPYTVTVPSVTSYFGINATTSLNTYDITVSLTDGGTITDVDNSTVINPPGGTVIVDHDASKTFEVTPAAHFQITSVQANSGDVTLDGNNQYTFSGVTSDQTFDVVFTEDEKFTLTVTLDGNGTGTVTSNPAGISCSDSGGCSNSFYTGELVELTATPDGADGSSFTGWSGEGCSGTDPCSVTMDQVRNVTASFSKPSSGNIFLFMPAINNAAIK